MSKKSFEETQKIRESISKENIYNYFDNNITNINNELFKIIADKSNADLFDSIKLLIYRVVKHTQGDILDQFSTDLGRIEYYVNNAGWNTDERRDKEIATIWALKDKYRGEE